MPVRAIAQTPDGYLWLGTEAVLYRFDGLHFLAWEPGLLQSTPSAMLCCRSTWRETDAFGSDMVPEQSCAAGNRLQNFIAGRAFPTGGFYPLLKIGMAPFGPAGHTASASMQRRMASGGQEMGDPLLPLSRCRGSRRNLWVATDQKDFGLSSDPVRRNPILTPRLAAARRFAATGGLG